MKNNFLKIAFVAILALTAFSYNANAQSTFAFISMSGSNVDHFETVSWVPQFYGCWLDCDDIYVSQGEYHFDYSITNITGGQDYGGNVTVSGTQDLGDDRCEGAAWGTTTHYAKAKFYNYTSTAKTVTVSVSTFQGTVDNTSITIAPRPGH